MDNQSAFTLMVQHLRTQGAPSMGDDRNCLYRHPDGVRRCAVGVLISTTEYNPLYENLSVEGLAGLESLQGIEVSLLRAMQSAHDLTALSVTGSEWAKRMEDQYVVIAKKFDLLVPLHPCGVPQATPQHTEVCQPA